MDKIPMTLRGFHMLQEELQQLKTVDRINVIQDIAKAREYGDLSENAEYHAAKERQGFIEGRINELDDKLNRAEIIDVTKLSGAEVKFGATVVLCDEETDEEVSYQIVGTDEADIKQRLLSITSPLARALIGRKKGTSVEVNTPGGQKSYEIIDVKYI